MSTDLLDRQVVDLTLDIRLCRREDLVGLEWEGLFTCHREVFLDAFEAQERGEAALVLAVVNGAPVGQVFVDLTRERAGYLWAVRVRPVFRGLGLGGRLLRAAEMLLLEAGLDAAELTVEKHNAPARRFYDRCGYHVVDESIQHWSTVTPDGCELHHELEVWVMGKPLRR